MSSEVIVIVSSKVVVMSLETIYCDNAMRGGYNKFIGGDYNNVIVDDCDNVNRDYCDNVIGSSSDATERL